MVKVAPCIVLNFPATQILGFYGTEEEANAAATAFGQCSFAYKLSPQEITALEVQA